MIESAHGTGEKSGSKQRTAAVKFHSLNYKIRILQNYKKVKGIRISIYKDCLKGTFAIRKEKWKEVLYKRPWENFYICSIGQ